MREIVVISGKGGTGKTSITASFASLAENKAVIADCDVDATDLHLICRPEVLEENDFFSGNEAVINPDKCIGCGKCQELCRFDAIEKRVNESGKTVYAVSETGCEGCGVCVRFCPGEAIEFPDRWCGKSYKSTTRFGPMFHAKLGVAAENSGKLVSLVRTTAKEYAQKEGYEKIIIDGPPGIGCPVIASITGADQVVVVSEPTLSGEHDLMRVADLAVHFNIPVSLIINKWDINPEMADRIISAAQKRGIEILGKVAYDSAFTKAQINEKSIVEFEESKDSEASKQIISIWSRICQKN